MWVKHKQLLAAGGGDGQDGAGGWGGGGRGGRGCAWPGTPPWLSPGGMVSPCSVLSGARGTPGAAAWPIPSPAHPSTPQHAPVHPRKCRSTPQHTPVHPRKCPNTLQNAPALPSTPQYAPARPSTPQRPQLAPAALGHPPAPVRLRPRPRPRPRARPCMEAAVAPGGLQPRPRPSPRPRPLPRASRRGSRAVTSPQGWGGEEGRSCDVTARVSEESPEATARPAAVMSRRGRDQGRDATAEPEAGVTSPPPPGRFPEAPPLPPGPAAGSRARRRQTCR